jgi:hypothetical protein
VRSRSKFGLEAQHSPQSPTLIGQAQSRNGLITGLQPTHNPSLNGFVDRADNRQARRARAEQVFGLHYCT